MWRDAEVALEDRDECRGTTVATRPRDLSDGTLFRQQSKGLVQAKPLAPFANRHAQIGHEQALEGSTIDARAACQLRNRAAIPRIVFNEPGGTETEFRFTDVQANAPVGAELFRFTPPPGTEIVYQ